MERHDVLAMMTALKLSGIHSTCADNLLMPTLPRGGPII